MDTVRGVVKEGGLLFLTVPIGITWLYCHDMQPQTPNLGACAGPDVLVWNLHRRYGAVRLPLLLQGWEQVEAVGWDHTLLHSPAPYTLQYEPVLVLRASPIATEMALD